MSTCIALLSTAVLAAPHHCIQRDCIVRRPAFNLGLPRTGTTWLHAVAKQMGMQSLHCAMQSDCVNDNGWDHVNRHRLRLDMQSALAPSADAAVRSKATACVDAAQERQPHHL